MKKSKSGPADTAKATAKTDVFQRSSVSMWEADISEMRAMVDALRSRGIPDLGKHLDEHPELIEQAVRSIRVIDVNDATLRLFETDDKDALLGPLPIALDAAALAGFKGLIVAVNEGKAVFETEVAARTFTGRRIDVIFKAHVPHGTDGDAHMQLDVFDITERKRLEEKLERERALLQTVIDNLPDYVYLKDRESRFLLANRSLALWLGASRPEDLVGRTDHDFFPRDLADAFRADEVKIIETGQSLISKEERSRSARGELQWVISTKMPIIDDSGAVTGIVGIGRDITERKLMEERSIRLATLVESSNDAIVGLDLQGVITSWNRGAEKVYGYAAEEIIGRSAFLLVPPELAEERRRIADRVRRGENVEHFESIRRRKDGVLIPISIAFFPIRDAEGALAGMATISRDITEQKNLQAQIMRAQRLESLATLAAGIAHQFNNINAVVKGYVDAALQSGQLPTTIAVYLREALKGVQRMVDITERLQGLTPSSRSGAERARVEVVARSLLPLFEKRLEEQGATLRLELLDTAPVGLDSSRIGFIVTSLITNALHAVIDQPIRTITLRSGADSASVFLEVGDTGCGIPPESLPQLFAPFFTTKGEWAPGSSAQSRVKGVGLSLAVCQSTVAECAGRIEVQSEPGKGSLFRVVLPIEEPGTRPTLPTP